MIHIYICTYVYVYVHVHVYVYIYIYIGGVVQALLDLNPAGRGPMGLGFRVVRLS